MHSRRENSSSTILISEKLMTHKPEATQLIQSENIAGILSESGLEVYRLSPKIQTVKHIKNSFNASVTSFCFDPQGQKVCYFLSNNKFMVLDLKDGDSAVQIFKQIKDEVLAIQWRVLSIEMDYNANPFHVKVYEDDFTPDLTKKISDIQ